MTNPIQALLQIQARYFKLEDEMKKCEEEKGQLLTMYNVTEKRLFDAQEALDRETAEHEKDCSTYEDQIKLLTCENKQFKEKIRVLTKELAEVKMELNELQTQCEGECC